MVELRQPDQVESRASTSCLDVSCTEHNSLHPCEDDGSCTHAARLQGDIKSALREPGRMKLTLVHSTNVSMHMLDTVIVVSIIIITITIAMTFITPIFSASCNRSGAIYKLISPSSTSTMLQPSPSSSYPYSSSTLSPSPVISQPLSSLTDCNHLRMPTRINACSYHVASFSHKVVS